MEKWNWSEISTTKKVITVAVATAVGVGMYFALFTGPLGSKDLEQDLAKQKSGNERLVSDFCSNGANLRYDICENKAAAQQAVEISKEINKSNELTQLVKAAPAIELVVEWIPEHCTAAVVNQGVTADQLKVHGTGDTLFVDASRNLHWIVNVQTGSVTLAKWFSPTDYRAVTAAEECVQ